MVYVMYVCGLEKKFGKMWHTIDTDSLIGNQWWLSFTFSIGFLEHWMHLWDRTAVWWKFFYFTFQFGTISLKTSPLWRFYDYFNHWKFVFFLQFIFNSLSSTNPAKTRHQRMALSSLWACCWRFCEKVLVLRIRKRE